MLFDELHRLATVGRFENSGFAFSRCYPRERTRGDSAWPMCLLSIPKDTTIASMACRMGGTAHEHEKAQSRGTSEGPPGGDVERRPDRSRRVFERSRGADADHPLHVHRRQ